MLAMPLVNAVSRVSSMSEFKSVVEFYRRPFRREDLEGLFRLVLCGEDVIREAVVYNYDRILTISREMGLVILKGLLYDDFWMNEYRMPYPETVGEFINHCCRCGFRLALREGVKV